VETTWGTPLLFYFIFWQIFTMLHPMGASQEGLALNGNSFVQLVQKVK
jgi:hypothetical protein